MKKRKIGFFALLICLLLSLPVSAAETKKEGWQKASNGVAYYYKNGKIAKGFVRIKNKTCYFNQRGKLVKDSWVFYKGKKYRADHWERSKELLCVRRWKILFSESRRKRKKRLAAVPYGLAYFEMTERLEKDFRPSTARPIFSVRRVFFSRNPDCGQHHLLPL